MSLESRVNLKAQQTQILSKGHYLNIGDIVDEWAVVVSLKCVIGEQWVEIVTQPSAQASDTPCR